MSYRSALFEDVTSGLSADDIANLKTRMVECARLVSGESTNFAISLFEQRIWLPAAASQKISFLPYVTCFEFL
jgi:hypothetical protein